EAIVLRAIARLTEPFHFQTRSNIPDSPRTDREPAAILSGKNSHECTVIQPFDSVQQERRIHPSEPSTRQQSHLRANEGEGGGFLIRTIVVGDENEAVWCLELLKQRVARQ